MTSKKLKRWLLLVGILLSVFLYGVLVGARQYPPYSSMLIVYSWFTESPLQTQYSERVSIDEPLNFDVSSIITIDTEVDVYKRREELVQFIWGSPSLPFDRLPDNVDGSIVDHDYAHLKNLDRIDRLTTNMEYGLNSIAYYFVPKKPNNDLIIYHQGHKGSFRRGIKTIEFFLQKGSAVIAHSMPLLGFNSQPIVDLERFGKFRLKYHDQIQYLRPNIGHPIKFFIEGVLASVNHAEKLGYDRISMTGISGGGWTTTLYAAIDDRILYSFPVAGTHPQYLSTTTDETWGDFEQETPDLLSIANYLELYILGSHGCSRQQLQILNTYEPRPFHPDGFKTYEDIVKHTVQRLGGGKFEVFSDRSHREHQISPAALVRISKELSKVHIESR